MPLILQTLTHGPIHLESGLPDRYNGYILSGGRVFSAQNKFGKILLQELSDEHFTIRFNVFQFFQKMTIAGSSHIAGLHSRVMLKNGLVHNIKGIGKLNLREGQSTLFCSRKCEGSASFESNREYQSFDVCLSHHWVDHLVEAFPNLDHLLTRESGAHKPSLIFKSPLWIVPDARDIIMKILHCDFNAEMRRIYFQSKVMEYFLLLLNQASEASDVSKPLSDKEVEAANAAKQIILSNIEERYTIPEISRKVGMNEFKLKKAYKLVHHLGIFETLHQARLIKAKQLLEETDKPMKEIYLLVGYERVTSFITAFRKHFGYSPGSIRRSKR